MAYSMTHRPSMQSSAVFQRKESFKSKADLPGRRRVSNFKDFYSLGQRLGEGGFGVVYEATHRPTGEVCAIKVVNKQKILQKQAEKKSDLMKYVTAEFDALEEIRHENIVKVLDLCEDDEHICVVMELIRYGNLGQLLMDRLQENDYLSE